MSTTMTTIHSNKNGKTNQNELTTQAEQCPQMCQMTFAPRFDIWEGDDEFILYGDLPGVDPENIEIEFENRQLTVHGKVCRRQDGLNYLSAEYGVGDFRRVFTMSDVVDGQGISAQLRAGELTIHLPKVAEAKPRRIKVKAD
jgi:HSP20 family protein